MQQLQTRPVGTPAVVNTTTGQAPISSAAYSEIKAATESPASQMQVFNTSDQPIKLALGAAAAEVDMGYVIPPSSTATIVGCKIPKGSRVSARSVGGTTTVGYLVVNFLG